MLRETFTTRRLVLMALFVAMSAALAPHVIWLTPQQKLMSFTLVPIAVGSVLFGPVAALIMGLASDTINYLIRPAGPYFFGYAVSLMLSCLIYALWQYKRPIKIWRIACAQLCSVIFVNFGLNLLWQSMLYGATAGSFYSVVRLVNNAVHLPFMVATVYVVAKAAAVIESRRTPIKAKKAEDNGNGN